MQHKPKDFDKEPHATASALVNKLDNFYRMIDIEKFNPDQAEMLADMYDRMEKLDYLLTAAKYRTAERGERKERQTKAK